MPPITAAWSVSVLSLGAFFTVITGAQGMNIKKDGKGQPYLEWEIGPGGFKRAWIQHRETDKDWANTGRYLNRPG
jgi:hypothetical protein